MQEGNVLNYKRYERGPVINFPERTWPSKIITKAPVWTSVDLRDGNQALVKPMNVEEKIEFFQKLCELGFKEIEVGFPSASQIEFDFIRQLVDRKLIPDDVYIQVLSQCREDLIKRTFESLKGVKKAIFHIYSNTCPLHREVVFKKNKEEVKNIAVLGTKLVKQYMQDFDGELRLEYSPESFSSTELDYALDVSNTVRDIWNATKENKLILNLPTTVECSTPNVFADQVEWMNTHLKDRDTIILSVHPHNDRGTGVAATELALMAGADRVEGTLFGNGERTGNVDILTLAYNMFSQGIDPELNLENEPEIAEIYERCTGMPIDDRHPYAGKLVFTAFSGSHQDAINKGVHALKESNSPYWHVPYLPVDPADIGRTYEPIVRINSQSGKGGVAFVLESYYGYKLPKAMHREFADIIQPLSEEYGEITPMQVNDAFIKNYVDAKEPMHFKSVKISEPDLEGEGSTTLVNVSYKNHGELKSFTGIGTGPIDAVQRGLEEELGIQIRIMDYSEHALTSGSSAEAVAYVHLLDQPTGRVTFGVGISSNITRASIRGIFSAINRLYYGDERKETDEAL